MPIDFVPALVPAGRREATASIGTNGRPSKSKAPASLWRAEPGRLRRIMGSVPGMGLYAGCVGIVRVSAGGHMRRRTPLIALCVATAALPQPALARDERSWDHAGSIGRDVLVIAALAVPAASGDWRGDLQAGESMGAAVLVTGGLKELLPEWRPDRSDRKSFPSGHTSASFAAAASLQNRYGWKIGIPA